MGTNMPHDKPDKNQAEIVAALRELGYTVEITKRPVDLFVIDPTGLLSLWVEVKSSTYAKLTKSEQIFFDRCPALHRIKAVSMDDVLNGFDLLKRMVRNIKL